MPSFLIMKNVAKTLRLSCLTLNQCYLFSWYLLIYLIDKDFKVHFRLEFHIIRVQNHSPRNFEIVLISEGISSFFIWNKCNNVFRTRILHKENQKICSYSWTFLFWCFRIDTRSKLFWLFMKTEKKSSLKYTQQIQRKFLASFHGHTFVIPQWGVINNSD